MVAIVGNTQITYFATLLQTDVVLIIQKGDEMNLKYVGIVLLLLIAIYFLFKLGYALADRYFNEPFFPWLGTIALTFFGFLALSDNNLIGFLGFIPICTYIFLKMASGLSWEPSVRKRAQAVLLSAGSSVVMYAITHNVFGFGVTEASLGAFAAAAILAFAGYTA